jgi:hypothetical protein
MGDANFAARVALRGELAREELAQLSTEDTVSNKLGARDIKFPETVSQVPGSESSALFSSCSD